MFFIYKLIFSSTHKWSMWQRLHDTISIQTSLSVATFT